MRSRQSRHLAEMRVVTIVLFALTLPFAIAYSIENCGPHQTDIEYAVTLAQTTMIRPLLDVATGTRSIHGFSAMFKSDNFKAFVQQLMTNILHLPPTPILAMLRDPIFVCVTNDVVRTYNPGYDPWTACQAREDVYGFYAKDTPWIFICSSFLEKLTPYPMFTPGGPLDIYCPIVQNNAFVGRPGPLVGYQNYQLVHLVSRRCPNTLIHKGLFHWKCLVVLTSVVARAFLPSRSESVRADCTQGGHGLE